MSSLNIVTHLKRAAKKPLRAIGKSLDMVYGKPEKWFYARGILSGKSLCLPDFLGIGAPQSGTTWLCENLRRHPGVYVSYPKEVHYFDRNFCRSLEFFYSNKFKSGRQKVKGEITPGYSIITLERIQFVRTIMPDVKLIFLMRNPIDRQWSAARRILSRLPDEKFEGVDESKFYAAFREEYAKKGDYAPGLTRGNYSAILDNWLSVFPREQLYIGFFEDIANRPKKLLSEVFAHIGVSRDVDWSSFPYKKVINKNPDFPMPEKYRDFLEEKYRQHIEALYKRFGDPVAGWRC